jgi:hypothetical protein
MDRLVSGDKPYYDAQDLADILGFKDAESVRRLGRKGKLPPRVPAVRKWLWVRGVVDEWIRGGHQAPKPEQTGRVTVVEDSAHPFIRFHEQADVLVVDKEGRVITKMETAPTWTKLDELPGPPQA